MPLKKNATVAAIAIILLISLGVSPIVHADTELSGDIKLVETLLSDNEAFTQGLELSDDKLVMGTGLYGESTIGWIDLDTGKYETVETLPDHYFGEGITFTETHLWQVTWRENTAFKRDSQTFAIVEKVDYESEGWGIAYDNEREVIWMSDGSEVLTVRDPDTFDELEKLSVTFEGVPLEDINELEFVDGALYANVWQTNQIVKINLDNGEVEKVFDFTEIIESTEMSEEEQDQLDVLNGIAHIEGQRFYITGKWYPVIYEVELLD